MYAPEHATSPLTSTPKLPALTEKEMFPTKSRVDVVVDPGIIWADTTSIPKTSERTGPEYRPSVNLNDPGT